MASASAAPETHAVPPSALAPGQGGGAERALLGSTRVLPQPQRSLHPPTPAQYHRIASCSVLKTGRGGRRARAPRTDPGRAAAGIGNSYTCRRPAAAEAAARDTRARCYEHGAKTE